MQVEFITLTPAHLPLHFSNTFSSESKLVTLDYELEHYILGMPQMLFLALVVVAICVAALAVFILMGRPR